MKLNLPTVTLVMVETREHELAFMALEECLKQATFGDVLVLTDRPSEFYALSNYCKPRIHTVPDWPEKIGWSRSWWYEVPPLVKTAQTLNIQWDSWICDTSMWRDDFLAYDYIGAPWWYKDGMNVGNGGFSLVSTRLKRYLRDRRLQYPCDTAVDDDLLCRKYRPRLEEVGFKWAPERVAHDFAFECCRPSPASKHFGFHAAFNFGEVLPYERLLERARIMVRSPYISNPNNHFWKAFSQKWPTVVEALREEAESLRRPLKEATNG